MMVKGISHIPAPGRLLTTPDLSKWEGVLIPPHWRIKAKEASENINYIREVAGPEGVEMYIDALLNELLNEPCPFE